MDNLSRVSEYKSLDEEKKEVINGDTFLMAPPSDKRHPKIIGNIYTAISKILKGSPCEVYCDSIALMCNNSARPYKTQEEKDNAGYVIPDLMIICDSDLINDGYYEGVPKFVIEVLSPSTAKRDKTIKFKVYESLGVSEYWIINTAGMVEIYYLIDGEYELQDNLFLGRDKNSVTYNEYLAIILREFPNIAIKLGEIFE